VISSVTGRSAASDLLSVGLARKYSGDLNLSYAEPLKAEGALRAHDALWRGNSSSDHAADSGFGSSFRICWRFEFISRLCAAVLVLVLMAGCAAKKAVQKGDEFETQEIADPIEPFNRAMFNFNDGLDTYIVLPVSKFYRAVLPEPVRDSVRNFLRNLGTPVILANDLLQGEGKRAETTVNRFLINTTIGLLGLFDVAFDMGFSFHDEDFGQTLAVWGADEGIYLVLPILGPMSTRHGIGRGVDIFIDPLTYVSWNNPDWAWLFWTRRIVGGIEIRSRNIETLDQLKKESLDFYALIRSIYWQNRLKEIRNGRLEDDDDPLPSRKGDSEEEKDLPSGKEDSKEEKEKKK
jgi:phospholipid-binding lipoprotein MlaA